jgi:hypothetical protein
VVVVGLPGTPGLHRDHGSEWNRERFLRKQLCETAGRYP